MNLKNINDVTLIDKTLTLVRQERELLTNVLHHLREIDRRRLYSSLGFKSLFDFTVKHLGYPEDQAYRRISAMKLLKEIPEIEEKINLGEITLTHIGLAQTLFRQEKKLLQKEMSQEEKISVIDQISNKSVREAEKITLSLSSSEVIAKPDRVKIVSKEFVELKFLASQELLEKVNQLKGLLAHTNPNLSFGELFEKLCDLGLQELDPSKTAAPRKRHVMNSEAKAKAGEVSANPNLLERIVTKESQAQIRRDVFRKANNCCENCGSHYALEIDHTIPQALGGSSDFENLRVLCRSCNQRAAIQVFGSEKMERYLDS